MKTMRHKHVGKITDACLGCYGELQADLKADLRARRFWGWVIVGFSLALAGVMAFVLFKVGVMGR